jgi:AraC-like DNA-binding protein
VKTLWVSRETPRAGGASRELVLPSGTIQLVFRLAQPLRVFDSPQDAHGRYVAHALIGGARAQAHVRDISQPIYSVGAQLMPGAGPVLLGVPAHLLSGQHTPLVDVWGAEAEHAREQLLALDDAGQQLDLFEALLLRRLLRAKPLDHAVAQAAAQLARGQRVAEVAAECGLSHKHFIQRFERSVGLPPKLYARVARLASVLPRIQDDATLALAAVAAGYSDQAHFTREFRALSGITPGGYLRLGPRHGHHVPLAETGAGKIPSRR